MGTIIVPDISAAAMLRTAAAYQRRSMPPYQPAQPLDPWTPQRDGWLHAVMIPPSDTQVGWEKIVAKLQDQLDSMDEATAAAAIAALKSAGAPRVALRALTQPAKIALPADALAAIVKTKANQRDALIAALEKTPGALNLKTPVLRAGQAQIDDDVAAAVAKMSPAQKATAATLVKIAKKPAAIANAIAAETEPGTAAKGLTQAQIDKINRALIRAFNANKKTAEQTPQRPPAKPAAAAADMEILKTGGIISVQLTIGRDVNGGPAQTQNTSRSTPGAAYLRSLYVHNGVGVAAGLAYTLTIPQIGLNVNDYNNAAGGIAQRDSAIPLELLAPDGATLVLSLENAALPVGVQPLSIDAYLAYNNVRAARPVTPATPPRADENLPGSPYIYLDPSIAAVFEAAGVPRDWYELPAY